jgi:hypothetical protein
MTSRIPPVQSDTAALALAAQSADAQLSALAALLSRATGSARVVPLDFGPAEPVVREGSQP